MRIGRILFALCGLVLAVSAMFAVSTVKALRDAVKEADEARERAEQVLAELRRETVAASAGAQSGTEREPGPTEETGDAVPTAAVPDPTYYLRAWDGTVCVFSEEGYLIRRLETDLRTLSPADRAALEAGVAANGREELAARIGDYTR